MPSANPRPPSTPSPRNQQRPRLQPSRLRLQPHQSAAWLCRRPDRALCTRRRSCRRSSPAQATWPPAQDCSVEDPSSIAVLRAHQAAIRRARPAADPPFPASSPADRDPSIRPARPWAVPEPPALQVRAPASALVLVLARLVRVPASVHVPAAQVELPQRARLPVRSVLLPVDAAAGRSIPKPKKAR